MRCAMRCDLMCCVHAMGCDAMQSNARVARCPRVLVSCAQQGLGPLGTLRKNNGNGITGATEAPETSVVISLYSVTHDSLSPLSLCVCVCVSVSLTCVVGHARCRLCPVPSRRHLPAATRSLWRRTSGRRTAASQWWSTRRPRGEHRPTETDGAEACVSVCVCPCEGDE